MLAPGLIIEGKYRIEALLGEGGMGAVYLAEHTRIKRPVAIKVLHAKNPDADAVKRFEREAEAAGRIGSDHIVEVLDFGTTPEGYRFMVMELLSGESLKDRLKREQTLAPSAVIPLLTQVLEGLSAAHDAGIVHRDLKPDNIFILREKAGRKDFVKIVDFGISKFAALSSGAGAMTQTGTVMGTPFYMSPEQAKSANEVDARSDLYAIGIILYEAITGTRPFNAGTLTELLFKIVFEDPQPPCALVPSIDPALNTIIMRAFAREPDERFQPARELQQALQSWAPGKAPASFVCSDARPTARVAPGAFPAGPAPAPPPHLVQNVPPRQPGPAHTMQSASHPIAQASSMPSAQVSLSPGQWAHHPAQGQQPLHPMRGAAPPQGGYQDGTLEPQNTWNRPAATKRGSPIVLVAALGVLLAGIAGGSFWWLRGRAPNATASAPDVPRTSVAATAEETASPGPTSPSVAPAEATASSEPGATTSASAQPTASASAPVASSKPRAAGRPGATSSAKPTGTVSDLGY